MSNDLSDKLYDNVVGKLKTFGVTIDKMVPTVYYLQKDRVPYLNNEMCAESLEAVLSKREVLHIVLVALDLDKASEMGLLDPTLQYILKKDEGLFGVDEDLAVSLVQLFGSIAVTNYGFLDVHKHGLAAKLDKQKYRVFLDDIVSALCAAAASRIAHATNPYYDEMVVHD